jgi:hypothetical protein
MDRLRGLAVLLWPLHRILDYFAGPYITDYWDVFHAFDDGRPYIQKTSSPFQYSLDTRDVSSTVRVYYGYPPADQSDLAIAINQDDFTVRRTNTVRLDGSFTAAAGLDSVDFVSAHPNGYQRGRAAIDGGNWSFTLQLRVGVSEVTVTLTDLLGRKKSVTIFGTYDVGGIPEPDPDNYLEYDGVLFQKDMLLIEFDARVGEDEAYALIESFGGTVLAVQYQVNWYMVQFKHLSGLDDPAYLYDALQSLALKFRASELVVNARRSITFPENS